MGSVGGTFGGMTSGLPSFEDQSQAGTSQFFGNDSTAGILGLGQFRGEKYDIDRRAFGPNESEMAFNRELLNRMNGKGPSVAELQMRAGADLAAQNAMGLASAQRGVNPAMAARLAQMSAAQGSQASNQQAGQLRAAEQLENAKLYGSQLASQRESRIGREQLGVQNSTGLNQVNQGGYEGASNRRGNAISSVTSGASAMSSMSDERSKTGVKSGDASIEGFLDALKAKSYEYKDPAMGAGRHFSPMAQDLEKTSVGKSMVVDTPAGKVVDYGKGFGAMLAAQANLNDRLSKLEGSNMADGGVVQGTQAMINGYQPTITPIKEKEDDGGGSGDMMGSVMKMIPMIAAAFSDESVKKNVKSGDNDIHGFMNALSKAGGKVPGKAAVSGDSEKNDSVHVSLSPGEMVVPRTIVKNGPDAIKAFAEELLKQGGKNGKAAA